MCLPSELVRRKDFVTTCATIWTFYLCLIHLINVVLPELISDENIIGDTARFLCNGAIKPRLSSPASFKLELVLR